MKSLVRSAAFAVLANLAVDANAHSWVEQMFVIQNGSYTGNPGYIRGYNPRGEGFSDSLNQNLVPALESGRIAIDKTDAMCKDTQTKPNYADGFPKLNAAPGDFVAMRYLENGHVTLPQNQKGKPGSGGTVMVYATTEPKEDEKLMDVLKWNTDGTGGDKRGKLLTTQNFDDGRCYQINDSPISTERQQKFPNKAVDAAPDTPNQEMWCETDIKLPEDAKANTDLTLYWAWKWDTLPNMDPGIPDGKAEWYTSCMDVAMVGAGQIQQAAVNAPTKLLVQDPQKQANPDFEERAANATQPDVGGDGNTPDAPSSDAPSSDAPSSDTPSSSAPAAGSPPPALSTATAAPSAPAPAASDAGAGASSAPPAPATTDAPGAPGATGPGYIGGGTGSVHTLTMTQLLTITFTDKKRGLTPRTAIISDIAAPKRRNIFA